jgi:hypothetical protein
MTKYHPGDKVTVKATVRHNCMSGRLLGVEFIGEGNIDNVTVVIPVDQIVSHEKVPLRIGDYIKSKVSTQSNKYKILALHKNTAWIIGAGEEQAHTVYLENFERV